jgi:CRP/FNR family cyclic AMP-dependent transcriptional regulator
LPGPAHAAKIQPMADPALSPDSAQLLAAHGKQRKYAKGAIIITQGDPSDAIYVIVSGRVKVYISDADGKEVVLAVHGPGDYIGEMSLDRKDRSASVMTLQDSVLSYVSHPAFRDFLAQHPDAAFDLVLRLIGRVRATTEALAGVAMMDAYGRLSHLLLSLAVEQDGHLVLPEAMTQQQLADRAACSREMVSRILKDLSEGGYVRLDKRRIHILRKLPARR